MRVSRAWPRIKRLASYTAAMAHSNFPPPSKLAQGLGLSGLLPFVVSALVLAFTTRPDWQALAGKALVAYGALIASFLGGIHWSLGMQGDPRAGQRLAWGVVPSVLAWAAFFIPARVGLLVVACVLLACYGVDRRVYPEAGLQCWLGLRRRLTTVAVLSCGVGAWAVW